MKYETQNFKKLKILFIIPGSGDSFYCGNCFRDNLQASALRKAGHDVIIMPLYLPLRHESFQADTPLFFPATTYYTEQKFFKNGKMPGWLKNITGSGAMLNLASSLSGTTSAEGMEDMTLSMITGNDPVFDRQVQELVTWIKNREIPDVIHLSSSLLIGIAKAIREQVDIPIVCSLQDEEVWIDSLNKKDADTAWKGITENIRHIDRFITTSLFYKEIATEKIPRINGIDVIYPGVDTHKYASPDYPEKPVIGFFYRMNRANGLDILAEAFIRLKKKNTIPGLRLKIGGGYTSKDKRFLKKIKDLLEPYREEVEINDNYSLDAHTHFYKDISVISVPITFDEGVGLYLCEAFAAGRPAVEPSTGSFPEIVDEGGILYSPNTSEALAEALEKILTDKDFYTRSKEKTLELSATRYNENVLAGKLIQTYESVIHKTSG